MTSECSPQRSKTACAWASWPRSTTTSIRSWLSESITSYGVIPVSRRETRATSISIPLPPLLAHSTVEEVNPAAPRSCIATSQGASSTSRQASISSFSRKGSPTWTTPRWEAWGSSTLAKVAPCRPSRPVSAPTRRTLFPSPVAREETICSARAIPTHIALTRGFSE